MVLSIELITARYVSRTVDMQSYLFFLLMSIFLLDPNFNFLFKNFFCCSGLHPGSKYLRSTNLTIQLPQTCNVYIIYVRCDTLHRRLHKPKCLNRLPLIYRKMVVKSSPSKAGSHYTVNLLQHLMDGCISAGR